MKENGRLLSPMTEDYLNSISSRERKKEDIYLNNLLTNTQTTSLNNQHSYFVKSFSFPNTPEMHQAFETLDKIARREGAKKSQLYTRVIFEFLQRHPLPNPQAQIDRMLEIKIPLKPTTQCCVSTCHRKTKWILRLQNKAGKVQEFQVCDGHKRWLHQDFRLLVSYRELR